MHRRLSTSSLLLLATLVACSPNPGPRPDAGADDVADVLDDTAEDAPDTDTSNDAEVGPPECLHVSMCDDGNPCTVASCEDGICVYVPSSEPVDDPVGDCRLRYCDADLTLVDEVDLTDLPLSDGIGCTIAACVDGEPLQVPTDSICSDGDRCNGIEVCGSEGCTLGDVFNDPDGDGDGDGIRNCEDIEECDGLDNDGDGVVDNDVVVAGQGEACYSGPEGTGDVGICRVGVVDCVDGRVGCAGEVLPEVRERCDGRDSDCDGVLAEGEVNCPTRVVVGRDPMSTPLEMTLAVTNVDVHFNLDTTGSRGGVIGAINENLVAEIIPSLLDLVPAAAFGVSTFEDFPFGRFGVPTDVPYRLLQRITTDIDAVASEIDGIVLGSGADLPESGLESLYQICTGNGVTWPTVMLEDVHGCGPVGRSGVIGELAPGKRDTYRVALAAGQRLWVEGFGDCAGDGIATVLRVVHERSGQEVATNSAGGRQEDPLVDVVAELDGDHLIEVVALDEDATGWYFLAVSRDDATVLPIAGDCGSLAVDETVVDLYGEDVVGTYAMDACVASCADVDAPTDWIESFCAAWDDPRFEEGACGNSVVDPGETCDDGGTDDGDACDARCQLVRDGVAPVDLSQGYNPVFGHGTRGGVGFRDDALPVVMHFTDAPSHLPSDYLAFSDLIDVHGLQDLYDECAKLGLRVIGVVTGESNLNISADDPSGMPAVAVETRATVPLCAFDGTEARLGGSCAEDECCVGRFGAGRPPLDNGECPLVFEIASGGSGVADTLVAAVGALTRAAPFNVSLRVTPPRGAAISLPCLMDQYEVIEAVPQTECAPEPSLLSRGDAPPTLVADATPGTRLRYVFTFSSRDTQDRDRDGDTEESCGEPGVYPLELEVLDSGGTVLARDTLTVEVTE